MLKQNKFFRSHIQLAGVVMLCIGVVILAYFVKQASFWLIFAGYSIAFVGYIGIIKNKDSSNSFTWQHLFYIAIALRFVIVFAFPSLSDDIYRFIWDGRLISQSVHPLSMLPSEIMSNGLDIYGIDNTIFKQLNSPNYFTIYPPFAQLIFTASVVIPPGSIISSAIFMKLFLLLGDIVCFYFIIKLLRHFEMRKSKVLYYALNPLVIIEVMGNMHFEGWMIAFLMGALYFLFSKKYIWAGVLLGLSVGTKLLPLMFVPIILVYIYEWKGMIRFGIALGICLLLQFVPYFYTLDFANFISSFQLYFQNFEFNAGIYYIFRAIGQEVVGYNIIQKLGPVLGLSALAVILIKSILLYKNRSNLRLIQSMVFIYFAYVLLAMTIHPWYIIMLVALTSFVHKKSVVAWSFLITLTYVNYSYDPYHENLWIVGLEYLCLFGLLLYEMILLIHLTTEDKGELNENKINF